MTAAPLTVVVVGGVAGGMSAATRLRRLDESAHIVVFERGPERTRSRPPAVCARSRTPT